MTMIDGNPAGPAHESSKNQQGKSATIDSNAIPSSMTSVAHSEKLSRFGAESELSESVVAASPTTDSHCTSVVNSPRPHEHSLAGRRVKVLDHESLCHLDRQDRRLGSQVPIEGVGSPGLFGAAMMLLRGSTNVVRSSGTTKDGIPATSHEVIQSKKQSIDVVGAITPGESNEEPAAAGLPREGNPDAQAGAPRHDRRREPSGPYQHALFTAPDPSVVNDSNDLPLVTIDMSAHGRQNLDRDACTRPGKRRSRTKHVANLKKLKTVHMIQAAGRSAPKVVPSKPTATFKPAAASGNVRLEKPSPDKPMVRRATVPEPPYPFDVDHSDEISTTSSSPKRFAKTSEEQYGITRRESDNFQAQVFFARKSRYIGVFPSAAEAASAVAEVKKALGRYEKPFTGDGDAAFRKARSVAFKAMGKTATRTAPDKGAGPRNALSDKDGARNAQKNAKEQATRKTKAKENQAQPTSHTSPGSNSEEEPSLSLLLLASVANAEKGRGNKKKRLGPSTGAATSSAVTRAGATKTKGGNSTKSKALATASVDLVHLAPAPEKDDPRVRAPESPPPSPAAVDSDTENCASPQAETIEYVRSKRVLPCREVFVTHHKEHSDYEVHVADEEMPLQDCLVSLGPTKKKEEALELFTVVCSMAMHAGAKFSCWLPEMAGALDLNKRMVPPMPPVLVSGYLGIAFVVDTLDWHVYGYLKDRPEPALIGKYRLFVDAVFAYNTAAKMQRYPALLDEHRRVALRVKDKVLAYIAATRPRCNIQGEHHMRFSLSNMRCMFAHGLPPIGGLAPPAQGAPPSRGAPPVQSAPLARSVQPAKGALPAQGAPPAQRAPPAQSVPPALSSPPPQGAPHP